MFDKKSNCYFLTQSYDELINLLRKCGVDIFNNYSSGLLCYDINVDKYMYTVYTVLSIQLNEKVCPNF